MATTIRPIPPPEATPQVKRIYVWQTPVRIAHTSNALAVFVLLLTGFFIHNPWFTMTQNPVDYPWLAQARFFHFCAAFALIFGLAVRFYWAIFGNAHSRSGMPRPWRKDWLRAAAEQAKEYMIVPGRGYVHLGHNALAGVSYGSFFLLSMVAVVTGGAMYSESNPGGFWDSITGWVIPLLGGSMAVRFVHFLTACLIGAFSIMHIYMVIYNAIRWHNGLIGSIVAGDKFAWPGDEGYDEKGE